MIRAWWRLAGAWAGLLLMSAGPSFVEAGEWGSFDRIYVQAGTYVHYSDGDYKGSPWFAAVEGQADDGWLYGIALFNNSFDQFSQYVYAGKQWGLPKPLRGFHVKLTGGVLHGYTGKYADKVPLNVNGWSPAIIPGIGYRRGRFGIDMAILGTAGLLFTGGVSF